jgi:competence protein ComEC
VLDVAWGARSFLLTGDLEATEEALLTPDLDLHDVLKVGHHGSCGASSAPFLQALSPRLAIIPVGAGNRLGHPCPAAMGRLAGARRLRTDLDGTIEVSTDGFDLAVRAWRADRGWRHLSWLEETVPNPSALTASGPLALAQSNPAR